MNKKQEIVVARMLSGDFIIGIKTFGKKKDDTKLRLEFPRLLDFEENDEGRLQVYSYLVCDPFDIRRLSEELTLQACQILFTINENELPRDVIVGYSQILERVGKIRESEKAKEKETEPKVDKDFLEKLKKEFKL
jgi:hypothetical protein